MPDFTHSLPPPHASQQRIIKDRSRFRVVTCGRRFGKTEVGKREILERASAGKQCWWVAPTYLMADQVWRDLIAAVEGQDGVIISQKTRRIDLPNGGMIAVRSGHQPHRLRGAGLDFVVLDEAAYLAPHLWPEVIRPMLVERRGGALFLSTPNGHNWFYDLFRLGMDDEEGEWRSFQFTTADNPLIAAEELDSIRRNTVERVWNQEYLAQFTADAGQVFRDVQAAATVSPDVAPEAGRRYVAGVDWGREGDYTVIAIMETTTRQLVALDRFNQVGWALQRGRLVELCDRWKPDVIYAEANSIGSPNIEALQAEGLPVESFTTTAASKPPLIESLALAIERREIALLPDETLLGELSAYRAQRMPGGGFRYSAPPGGHDDTVIALALAYHALRQPRVSLDFW
ncbi:MAG: terminase family protein [Anaerolineae bacterium]|nr:terminase family protein [Anaerolineae bacterium]